MTGTILLAGFPGQAGAESFPKESFEHYAKYLLHLKKDQPEKALAEIILAYQTNPKAQHLLSEIVEIALDLRQIDVARVYANIAKELNPKNPEAGYLQAQVLQALGKYEESLQILLEAKKINPENPSILMALASVYAQLDKRPESLAYLNAYLKLSPRNPELLKIKAQYEIQEGSAASITTLEEAFREDPEDPEIIDTLIAAYHRFSTGEKLDNFFERAIRENPDVPDLPIKRCGVKETPALQQGCLESLVQEDPANTAALGFWLDLLEKEEQWDEALDILRQYPEATSHEPIFALKESFYLLHQDRLESAILVLEKAREKYPGNDDIPYYLSLGYEDLNNHDKAKSVLSELYKRRPDWREMAYTYALICGETQDYACMEQVLETLRRSHPDDPVILNALGFTWTEENKNLEQARQLVERALAADPTNYSYQDSLAWVLFKLGHYQEALDILKNAAEQTQDAEILLHLSELEQHEGQAQQAWASYLSAHFELARTRKQSARLLSSLAHLEKLLDHKAKPKTLQVLEQRVAQPQDGLSGLFQCEWRPRGAPSVRMRFAVNNRSGELKISYWPPGMLMPINKEQVAESFAPSRPIIEEFEAALKGFFMQHSWSQDKTNKSSTRSAAGALQWKIKENFSVKAAGSTINMEFSDFYRDLNLQSSQGAGGLVPRFIELKSAFLNGTCEALDYAKE
ncbi:MAG: tetratricopeptide repeat protein [Elusimicrobia bacterium]|nr:tetratricopeptide repeat protein [Elusimicrobiota bacterium]